MHPTDKAMGAQGRLCNEPCCQLDIRHNMSKIAEEAKNVVHERHIGDGLALLVRASCLGDLHRELRQLEEDSRAGVAAHAVQKGEADENLRLECCAEVEGEVADCRLERQHGDLRVSEAGYGRGGDIADARDGRGVVRYGDLEAVAEGYVNARIYGNEKAWVEEGANDRNVRDGVGLQGDGGEVDSKGVADLGGEPGGGELNMCEEIGGCKGNEAIFDEADDVVGSVGGCVVTAKDEGTGQELERSCSGAVDAADREAWWNNKTFGICSDRVVGWENLRVEELEAYVLDYVCGSRLFGWRWRGERDIGRWS